jgi:hypothetical protein
LRDLVPLSLVLKPVADAQHCWRWSKQSNDAAHTGSPTP